jgi:sugar phosphate isomerase/epimerase
LIQHLGTPNESYSPAKFDAGMTAVEHLRAFAKPLGVTLLLENIPNELSSAEKLAELLHVAHFTDVGFCFDIGHAHLTDGVRVSFEMMKEHIRSTHLHDNNQNRDAHLWPGEGTIHWADALELLRSAPHVPPLLLEIEGDEKVNLTQKMAETFNKFEQSWAAA